MQGAAASVPGPSLGVVGQGMHGPPPPPDDGALPPILAHGFVGVRNDSPTRREITDEDGIVRRLIIFHANYDNRLQEIEMMDSLTVGKYICHPALQSLGPSHERNPEVKPSIISFY